MTPGIYVMVKPEWRPLYRKPGAPFEGAVVAMSPSGAVARVYMDDLGDSYVRTEHLDPVPPPQRNSLRSSPFFSLKVPLT